MCLLLLYICLNNFFVNLTFFKVIALNISEINASTGFLPVRLKLLTELP
jgi:hypothetical protein